MSLFGIFVTFWLVWWMLFFMVLPVGVRINPNPEEGHASSAPENPRLLIKLVVTTVMAVLVTGVFFYLMAQGYLDWIHLRPESE